MTIALAAFPETANMIIPHPSCHTTHTALRPQVGRKRSSERTVRIDPVPSGGSEDFATEQHEIEPLIVLPARKRMRVVKKKGGMK